MASGGGATGGGPTTENKSKPPRIHVLRGHRKQANLTAGEYKSGPDDKTCIVCYREVRFYSVGSCNHSVCYECSSRMRVLMEQNECPICRHSLQHVIFTRGLKEFPDLKDKLRMFIFLPQWGLYLEDEDVKREFEKLLEHQCNFCKEEQFFRDFKELKIHVQRVHDLFSCDLCSEHIKLFSIERRFYNRADLAYHKRKGDRSDKSHRGHPLCQFCDKRYFDQDELYKHLRKDHYFCHFCDADGFNHYYNTFDDLRIHFRREHFLCEEEHCKDEKFTNVFRSEIDMKAHLTAVHSRLLGKHGTKQARVIDLEFNIKNDDERRSRRFNGAGFVGRGGGMRGGRDGFDQREEEFTAPQPNFEPTNQPKVDSVTDFPLLEGAGATTVLPMTNGTSHASSSIAQKVALTSGRNVSTSKQPIGPTGTPRWNARSRQDEEFPALGLSDSSVPSDTFNAIQQPSKTFTNAAAFKPNTHPPRPTTGPIHRGISNGVLNAQEEFPSLGNPSKKSSANGSAWKGSGVKMKGGQTPRHLKIAPAPLERKVEVDPSGEFNFVPLSVNRARKDSITKKYENFIDETNSEEPSYSSQPVVVDEKIKKKKVKSDGISSTAKAAAALFNGGKPKSKTSKGSAANSNSHSMNLQAFEDFPSLEPVKKSLPTSSSVNSTGNVGGDRLSPPESGKFSNPNIAGITVSGPPPGFSTKPLLSNETDHFDLSFLSSSSSSNSVGGKSPNGIRDKQTLSKKNGNNNNNNNNKNNMVYEDLELLKAKAGSLGKLYTQPPDFTKRNLRLLEGVKSSLSGDESSFEMFRSVSSQYRKGEINSKEYYELCQDMFGMTDFRVIFPELLALLPEIGKQQELLASHRRSGGVMTGLSSCHECFQVIKAGDMSAHLQAHSAADLFPALAPNQR